MELQLHIYDNQGATFDRYTAVYLAAVERDGSYACLGMSENPTHPQGFGQHGYADDGDHLGMRISIMQLPRSCRELVMSDYKAIMSDQG